MNLVLNRGAIAFYEFEKDRKNLNSMMDSLQKAFIRMLRENSGQELQTQAQVSKFEFQVQKSLSKMTIDHAKFFIYTGAYSQAVK